ncbi:hypothetical protein FGO68_gene12573 [Halteria grandinella]|uniref:Uncharacterized protein n=1 Tax=Halteria grandinella TaxID=5974 RepID=A0A8J8NP77_HALGN|nr:hypothetical protein FGO68_gene12573 [Halteria grandinella]
MYHQRIKLQRLEDGQQRLQGQKNEILFEKPTEDTLIRSLQTIAPPTTVRSINLTSGGQGGNRWSSQEQSYFKLNSMPGGIKGPTFNLVTQFDPSQINPNYTPLPVQLTQPTMNSLKVEPQTNVTQPGYIIDNRDQLLHECIQQIKLLSDQNMELKLQYSTLSAQVDKLIQKQAAIDFLYGNTIDERLLQSASQEDYPCDEGGKCGLIPLRLIIQLNNPPLNERRNPFRIDQLHPPPTILSQNARQHLTRSQRKQLQHPPIQPYLPSTQSTLRLLTEDEEKPKKQSFAEAIGLSRKQEEVNEDEQQQNNNNETSASHHSSSSGELFKF